MTIVLPKADTSAMEVDGDMAQRVQLDSKGVAGKGLTSCY